jgi:hypothetical protein
MTPTLALIIRLILYAVICMAAPAVLACEMHHPIEHRLHDVVRRGADADFDEGILTTPQSSVEVTARV